MRLGETWRKVRRMGADEAAVRTAQACRKQAERFFSLDQGEWTDAAFRRRLAPAWRGLRPEAVVRQVISRLRSQPFMPGLADRAAAVRLMNGRFGDERAALVDRAERAIKGRFDLLGRRDLSFGDPIDWRLEPISGKRTALDHGSRIPFLDGRLAGDKKIVWELNRHRHFVTLGQAYWLTGDERYAGAFADQIVSWMEANPPRRGINWASSLEVAFRSIAWLWALHLFAGSERLAPALVWRIVKNLAQHGAYVRAYLSHYYSPNTHLTGEALGLFYLGTTLPELGEAEEWRRAGLCILLDQLPKQVRSDGVYFEQASYYHRYTIDVYLHLKLRAQTARIALPPWIDRILCAMLDHLMWITRPDGKATLYGDDDGGRLLALGEREADDFRDTLALGAALYGRPDWKAIAGRASADLSWTAGAEVLTVFDRLPDRPPPPGAKLFEAAGCVVLRDGWEPDATYLWLDAGVHGALRGGHAHADALSFEFCAGGITWLVDPGTYTYTGDAAAREAFRTTAGHNTVLVDGLPQSIPGGPFSWTRVASACVTECRMQSDAMIVAGTHDGYLRLPSPVRHTRAFVLSRRPGRWGGSALIVTDRLESTGSHHYELRLHLAPGCSVAPSEDAAHVLHVTGRRLFVAVRRLTDERGCEPVAPAVQSGWVSRCYGHKEAAPVLSAQVENTGPLTLVTLLVPAVESPDWEELMADLSFGIAPRAAPLG
ncbi:alginate lyase family protein [Nitrospira moscoviensis]|uniref:Putative Heparinase II/III family protein n=1 Tax=Nitrospira moscoviensis TaxID=42253 RepID=A0A0K2GDL2_NITMO|nr:alginate lyase family protein [Nitrospira moscoviensis]ALA59045.1 putative Heparinase II/III family protein [Nitrospira moscoviensis]